MYQVNVYEKHLHGLNVLASCPIKSEVDMWNFENRKYGFVFDGNPLLVEIIANADKEYAQIAKLKVVWNAKMLWNAVKTYFDRQAMMLGYGDVFDEED